MSAITMTPAAAQALSQQSYELNVQVGAAEAACKSLLARDDLTPAARTTVESLAMILGVDDPSEQVTS